MQTKKENNQEKEFKVTVNNVDIDPGILQKHAMLINVNIKKWNNNRQSKAGTARLEKEFGIENGYKQKKRVRAYKSAIDPEHLKPMDKICNAFRTYIYEKTLPYDNSGKRLLPASIFEKVNNEIRSFKDDFDQEKETIRANFESWKRQAELDLNGLYNAADYPSNGDLDKKYQYRIDFEPVPAASAFEADILDKYAAEIRQQIEKNSNKTIENALSDCWKRIFDNVSALAKKMHEKKTDNKTGQETTPIFRNSIIENINDLVELLPDLNITNDRELENMRQKLQDNLAGIDPAELRESKESRQEIAEKADNILQDLDNIF